MARTLPEWLAYLEALDPHKITLGLERVKKVAAKLQLTQFSCPVITIAGTNGKGSCVRLLESCFLAGNYRVAAYTSPHLFRFNERIRINGIDIADEALCEAFTQIATAAVNVPLTYFEFTTLAALQLFKNQKLDVIILEIGLGGRLDAVNIIHADIAVITSIDIDHTDWLGPDRESIGREKAGIFRANQAVVCGDFQPPASLVTTATELNCRFYLINQDYHYAILESTWSWQSSICSYATLPLPHLKLQNAATVLMALTLLRQNLSLSPEAIATGLANARLIGRFQQVSLPKSCIFDVAHNPHAAQWLAQQLRQTVGRGKTIAVAGMLADKDIFNTFRALQDEIDVWNVGGLPPPRGAGKNRLEQELRALGAKKWYTHDLIEQAYEAAIAACGDTDRIVIFGSFITVAHCWAVSRKAHAVRT